MLVTLYTILSLLTWTENFSQPDSAMQAWQGDWGNLCINARGELQNHVNAAATSYLMRPSTAAIEAEWSFYTRIYNGTSAYNQTRFYILSADSITADAFYVQVGGTNHNITLYQLRNGRSTKRIESDARKNILPDNDAKVQVRLTRDADGDFHLYSMVTKKDSDLVEEGSYHIDWMQSQMVALYMKNSKDRGKDLYFDNITVSGKEQEYIPQEDDDQNTTTPSASTSSDIVLQPNTDYLSLHQQSHVAQFILDYTAPADTYIANMQVYSADGRLMRTCYRLTPMETSGQLVWNGCNDKEQKVEIGIYVIILEITSKTNAPIRKRYPVAVVY